jgi:hypothetical protein
MTIVKRHAQSHVLLSQIRTSQLSSSNHSNQSEYLLILNIPRILNLKMQHFSWKCLECAALECAAIKHAAFLITRPFDVEMLANQ